MTDTDTRIVIDHAWAECSYQERDTGAWVACPVCEDNDQESFDAAYVVEEQDYEPDFDDMPLDWDYDPRDY